MHRDGTLSSLASAWSRDAGRASNHQPVRHPIAYHVAVLCMVTHNFMIRVVAWAGLFLVGPIWKVLGVWVREVVTPWLCRVQVWLLCNMLIMVAVCGVLDAGVAY